ncbi:hypothetical protein EYC84_002692 [Monilinia fructicola]|uniref:Uncharacterized protein n=1 Tax=Monilinia fructicola TaxID=38448 RepID=A0A5M9JPT0_MONFR|nr:hypothetical protein EYC84_002692 [Monilinia fructicola]
MSLISQRKKTQTFVLESTRSPQLHYDIARNKRKLNFRRSFLKRFKRKLAPLLEVYIVVHTVFPSNIPPSYVSTCKHLPPEESPVIQLSKALTRRSLYSKGSYSSQ